MNNDVTIHLAIMDMGHELRLDFVGQLIKMACSDGPWVRVHIAQVLSPLSYGSERSADADTMGSGIVFERVGPTLCICDGPGGTSASHQVRNLNKEGGDLELGISDKAMLVLVLSDQHNGLVLAL